MSPPAAHQAEGSLSSNDASSQGSHPTTSSNIPNEEPLSGQAPSETFANSLRSSSDGPEMTDNDPSDVKVSVAKTELDANHEETSPLGVPATEISGDHKDAILSEEDLSLPDTPPNEDTSTPAGDSTPTLSETTPSISSEEELHVSNTASISSSALQMVGGAQVAATEHKDTNPFDIFDSNDHNTIGGSECHSIHSPDGSIFIDNGLVSPKDNSVLPSLNGHIVTPAPNKTASILTPPSSREKTSVASPCSQEMAPGIPPFENKTLFAPSHENHNGDVRTLEQNDLPTLPREDGHNGDIHTPERSDPSTLLHEDGHSGDFHTLEQDNTPTLPQEAGYNDDTRDFKQNDLSKHPLEESHTGDVIPPEENGRFSLPHEESYNSDIHTLEPDNISTLPHESHSGDATRFQQNDHHPLPNEGSYNGDVYTLEQSNHSKLPHAENHGSDVTPFQENSHYPLPHEESYKGDVHILEQNNPSGVPDADNHSSSVTPFKENHQFAPPQENHCGDVAIPNKIPHKPCDAPETTKGKEKNNRHPPRGDYWRPSMTDSRAHSYYRDGHQHREIEGPNHRFRSSGYHLNDPDHSNHERRARSRSPARDIRRGRFRDLSPFRGRARSRNGFHSLSGSNASHQAEDRSIRYRPGTRTFNGDRYVPPPEPDNHARRSPAPSPGRELTPPRRARNRSRSRPGLRTPLESRSGPSLEYIPPIRSSRPLPDQSVAFQSNIRSLNSCRRHGVGSAFEGGRSAGMRNSNFLQSSIQTSPKRPEKRRRHEDEWPAQHKRSRRDEQSHNDRYVRDYKAPRSYGPR